MYKKIIVCLLVLLSLAVPVVAGEICVDIQTGNNISERVFVLDAGMATDQLFFLKGKNKQDFPVFGVGFITNDQVIASVGTQDGPVLDGNLLYRFEINLDTLLGQYQSFKANEETSFGQARLVSCSETVKPFVKSDEFVDSGDGTIYQTSSELVWQKAPVLEPLSWYGAVQYCNRFSMEGKTDWRLPTLVELNSLVDMSQSGVKISPVFENTPPVKFYSSTPFYARPDSDKAVNIWSINFGTGIHEFSSNQTVSSIFRCVHN